MLPAHDCTRALQVIAGAVVLANVLIGICACYCRNDAEEEGADGRNSIQLSTVGASSV